MVKCSGNHHSWTKEKVVLNQVSVQPDSSTPQSQLLNTSTAKICLGSDYTSNSMYDLWAHKNSVHWCSCNFIFTNPVLALVTEIWAAYFYSLELEILFLCTKCSSGQDGLIFHEIFLTLRDIPIAITTWNGPWNEENITDSNCFLLCVQETVTVIHCTML